MAGTTDPEIRRYGLPGTTVLGKEKDEEETGAEGKGGNPSSTGSSSGEKAASPGGPGGKTGEAGDFVSAIYGELYRRRQKAEKEEKEAEQAREKWLGQKVTGKDVLGLFLPWVKGKKTAAWERLKKEEMEAQDAKKRLDEYLKAALPSVSSQAAGTVAKEEEFRRKRDELIKQGMDPDEATYKALGIDVPEKPERAAKRCIEQQKVLGVPEEQARKHCAEATVAAILAPKKQEEREEKKTAAVVKKNEAEATYYNAKANETVDFTNSLARTQLEETVRTTAKERAKFRANLPTEPTFRAIAYRFHYNSGDLAKLRDKARSDAIDFLAAKSNVNPADYMDSNGKIDARAMLADIFGKKIPQTLVRGGVDVLDRLETKFFFHNARIDRPGQLFRTAVAAAIEDAGGVPKPGEKGAEAFARNISAYVQQMLVDAGVEPRHAVGIGQVVEKLAVPYALESADGNPVQFGLLMDTFFSAFDDQMITTEEISSVVGKAQAGEVADVFQKGFGSTSVDKIFSKTIFDNEYWDNLLTPPKGGGED